MSTTTDRISTLRPVEATLSYAESCTRLRIYADSYSEPVTYMVDGINEDTHQVSELVEGYPSFSEAVASLTEFPERAGIVIRPRRTPTRAEAIRAAAALWAGTDPEDMRDSEYLRGQVELIADLFGHDYEADPERTSLVDAIVKMAQE